MIVIYYQIKILIGFWYSRYRTLYLLFDNKRFYQLSNYNLYKLIFLNTGEFKSIHISPYIIENKVELT